MKKNIFLVVFTLLGQLFVAQNQQNFSQYEAKYIVQFLRDTADINTKREEVVSLLIGDNISLFKSTQKAIADSVSIAETKKSFQNPVNGKIIINYSNVRDAVFRPEVYKKDNSTLIYNEILNYDYCYEMNEKINWKIEQETKVISTYKCRKATGKYKNRNYIAWFAEEIPFSEGPYVFKGLPGLIVEIYDTKDYYHFKLGGFTKVKKPIVPSNSLRTDYEKFVKARNNFMLDPTGTFSNQFSPNIVKQLINNKEQKERLDKMHRSNNNFLD